MVSLPSFQLYEVLGVKLRSPGLCKFLYPVTIVPSPSSCFYFISLTLMSKGVFACIYLCTTCVPGARGQRGCQIPRVKVTVF